METQGVLINLKEKSITKLLKCLELLKETNIDFELLETGMPVNEKPQKTIHKNYESGSLNFGRYGISVLELLSKGYTYNQIADELEISVDGVRYYTKKIFKELGVNNGREATKIYLTQLKQNATYN